MTKQEILDAIKDFSEDFPKEALMAIQANRESFIPELLDSLDFAYHNAKELSDNGSDYFLHTYAMFLLAEFRERRAFPLLTALLTLPEDEINFILGDSITESFQRLLFCTFDNENMQMLLDVVENQELYEWARLAAVGAYELFIRDGIVTNEEGVSYLRNLIYDKLPSDDSYVVFTAIVGCVIQARLVDMIPDVRFLYDNNRVDASMYGEYDGFIDWIFYRERRKSSYIDDAISEMEWWACFKSKRNSMSEHDEDNLTDIFDEMQKGIEQEKMLEQKMKKVGRNDPCPCGSGKKYKKCCIDTQQNNISVTRLEDRYDLLKMYPKDSVLFEQMYDKEAVAIDVLVYKALHHRAIPIWEKRDRENERIGKINYLNEALTLFLDKCKREQIASFSVYDEQFMVHYRSDEWVSALVELVENSDSEEIETIRQRAKDTLHNMRTKKDRQDSAGKTENSDSLSG